MMSVKVDKSKIEEVKAILSASSAREAAERSLQFVIALHKQQEMLAAMKATPLLDEHRSASVVE